MEARIYPDTGTTTVHVRRAGQRQLRRPSLPAPQLRSHAGAFTAAYIVACDGNRYRIDDGQCVSAALSCVIRPEPGDLVQLFHAGDQCFITAILRRAAFERQDTTERSVEMAVAGADTLLLNVPKLRCVASDSIALVAGKSCEIASPQGRLTLTAKNLFAVASDNFVQQARTTLTQAVYYSVKALELLHLKGHRQLISAETEVRLDGQYINMG